MKYVSGAFYTFAVVGFLATYVMSLKPLVERKAHGALIAAAAQRVNPPKKAARRTKRKAQLAAPILR